MTLQLEYTLEQAVRLWLRAIGDQWAVREVHLNKYPDPDTRLIEPYCAFRISTSVPQNGRGLDHSSVTSYTATRSGEQKHAVTVVIDLFEHEYGRYVLGAMSAGVHDPQIQEILDTHGCGFQETVLIENLSTTDDERTEHHQQMTCIFTEGMQYELSETNAAVTTVSMTYEVDGEDSTVEVTE